MVTGQFAEFVEAMSTVQGSWIVVASICMVFYIIFEYLQEKLRKPMEIEASPQVQVEAQRNEEELKALNKDNNQ